jgi:hypothetical protein
LIFRVIRRPQKNEKHRVSGQAHPG